MLYFLVLTVTFLWVVNELDVYYYISLFIYMKSPGTGPLSADQGESRSRSRSGSKIVSTSKFCNIAHLHAITDFHDYTICSDTITIQFEQSDCFSVSSTSINHHGYANKFVPDVWNMYKCDDNLTIIVIIINNIIIIIIIVFPNQYWTLICSILISSLAFCFQSPVFGIIIVFVPLAWGSQPLCITHQRVTCGQCVAWDSWLVFTLPSSVHGMPMHNTCDVAFMQKKYMIYISMGLCKKDVTPLR